MIDEGLAGIRRLRARALRHARSRDLTRARTPNLKHVSHWSREPATRIIQVVLSRPKRASSGPFLRRAPGDQPQPIAPSPRGRLTD
jgi:hypothetical protein